MPATVGKKTKHVEQRRLESGYFSRIDAAIFFCSKLPLHEFLPEDFTSPFMKLTLILHQAMEEEKWEADNLLKANVGRTQLLYNCLKLPQSPS